MFQKNINIPHLPFELICCIYDFLDIDTKIEMHKIYSYESFLSSKIKLSSKRDKKINRIINDKFHMFEMQNELNKLFKRFEKYGMF